MTDQQFPGWLPIQIANHYGFPLADWAGAGQTIAIISLGGKLDEAELKTNFRTLRIPWPDVTITDVGDRYTDRQNNGSTDETHLDLEVIGTICADARITIYRGVNDGGPGFVDAVRQAIADDNSVISISWGHTESENDARTHGMEEALEDAKSKNITVCVAAGDAGSSDCRDGLHAITAPDGRAHVQYPASSPHVLCCGGTQLMLKDDQYYEVVWNNSALGKAATGGGVSRLFERPQWQTANSVDIPSANKGGIAGRVIPDVAAIAAGGTWGMFKCGDAAIVGGTSAVAPLYASLIALANQKRESLNKARLGFLNARLYKLAGESGLFNNIVEGHNRPAADYPGYNARKGFDACTGWGTPIAATLFEALVELE